MASAFSEAPDFLAAGGLSNNGAVMLYPKGDEEHGIPYELKSIAWRLLDDLGVGVVAYNDPKSMHCLSPNQQMETFVVLEHARRCEKVKAIVWTATGTRAFNAGAALKGDKEIYVPADVVNAYRKRGMAPFATNPKDMVMTDHTRAFWDFPKPLIFAINGLAVGGGANTALSNFGDIILASRNARFMWPFAKLGLTPELSSSMMIPWLVGMPKAKELMMTGRWLSAEEACKLNLVNDVLAPEELLPHAVTLAAQIAKNNPEAMRLMKRVMNAPVREQLDAVLAREQETIMESVKASGGFTKNNPLKSKL